MKFKVGDKVVASTPYYWGIGTIPERCLSLEVSASNILKEASDCLVNRAVERDKEGGERSMKSCVKAFNALTGHTLTEEQGWIFMAVLKAARSQGGAFKLDDYVDGASYFALAGEAAKIERGSE